MVDFDAIMAKDKEVKRKAEALQMIWARATDTSPKITGMPSGGGDGKRMERDVVGIVDAEKSYLQSNMELKAMREELATYLPRLTKWQHKDVIQLRYMEGKDINSVAERIGYEYRQTCRFIDEAKRIILAKMS